MNTNMNIRVLFAINDMKTSFDFKVSMISF